MPARRLRLFSCAAASSIVVAACGEAEPRFKAPMTLGGVEVSAEVLNAGARTYELRCASCHGAEGSGEGAGARALKEKPRDFRAANFKYKSTPGDTLPTDADLASLIRTGKVENGMPAWPALTDQDLAGVIAFIKTFSPRWQDAANFAEGGAGGGAEAGADGAAEGKS